MATHFHRRFVPVKLLARTCLMLICADSSFNGRTAAMAQGGAPRNEALGSPKIAERLPIWPDRWPWSSVGRINIALSTKRTMCTGSLVGPRTVITAAHCLFDDTLHQWIKPNVVHFLAGLSPGAKFAGHSVVSSYIVSPNYKDRSEGQSPDFKLRNLRPPAPYDFDNLLSDWAILAVEDSLNLKPIPVQSMRNAILPGSDVEKEIVLPGYGADRPELLGIARGCMAKTDGQKYGQGSLEHTCDIARGNSGGPVLLMDGQNTTVIGIVTGSEATRLPSIPAHGGFGISATEFEQALATIK
jgi:protease YdgD